MHKLVLYGRIYPSGARLNATGMPQVRFPQGGDLAFPVDVTFTIIDSVVQVNCTVEQFNELQLVGIWIHAVGLVSITSNLISFKMGIGTIVMLDQWQFDEGPIVALNLHDPELPALCSVIYNNISQEHLTHMILRHPEIGSAINDLILAITMPLITFINCARAVEAIRHLIAGHDSAKKTWPIMHAALNLSREYVDQITEHSTDHRHGHQILIPPDIRRSVVHRSWVIMDRFLHYKKRGSLPLPIGEFPLLLG